MLGRNTILTISCALQASAFLLPPGATAATKDSLLPFSQLDTKTHILSLPCASCSSKTADAESEASENKYWIQDTRRHSDVNLLLNFTISDDGSALLLNNEQIYPVSYNVEDLFKPEWFVKQVDASVEQDALLSGDFESSQARITGHMLGQADGLPATPNGDKLVSIAFQLLSLDHEMADVDEVLVQMIRTTDDELMLLAVDTTPDSLIDDVLFLTPSLGPIQLSPLGDHKPEHPPHHKPGDHPHKPEDRPHRPEHPPHKNCKHLPAPLCSVVDFIDSKINNFHAGKPKCAGKSGFGSFDGHLPTHIRPHFGQEEKVDEHHKDGKDGKDGKFGAPRPHHGEHHRHHHHKHGVFHSVSRAILAVLIPAMAGILVGMVVSILGLFTGRFIGWLWFTVIRGGKKGGYTQVAADDIVIIVTDADKKEAFVEETHLESLPRYEDAPVYEETEKEVL